MKYLFHHIHLVQWVYLQTWRGDPFQVTELTGFADLAAIEGWAKPYYRLVSDYAATVDESKFAQPVECSWSQLIADKYGKVIPATLSESAWQVF